MSKSNSEPPENWQRVLAAAKASPATEDKSAATHPPEKFRSDLVGRVRAFHASLAAWQRWSLLAGLASILIFLASLIYLKQTSADKPRSIIKTPAIDLPQPSTTPTKN